MISCRELTPSSQQLDQILIGHTLIQVPPESVCGQWWPPPLAVAAAPGPSKLASVSQLPANSGGVVNVCCSIGWCLQGKECCLNHTRLLCWGVQVGWPASEHQSIRGQLLAIRPEKSMAIRPETWHDATHPSLHRYWTVHDAPSAAACCAFLMPRWPL